MAVHLFVMTSWPATLASIHGRLSMQGIAVLQQGGNAAQAAVAVVSFLEVEAAWSVGLHESILGTDVLVVTYNRIRR